MLRTIAKVHPFLWLGAFTVLAMAVGPFVPLEYDDQGLGTAWFRFSYALTWVFRQAAHFGALLSGSPTGALHTLVTILLGVAIYVAADLMLSAGASRFGGRHE